ncbi:mobilization protein [Streptomyces regalis]|uniref:Mobilization protein n=2 Tax=Streptomyces regalis TaxID=68262 RepID=A0A117MN21_9ACTN|nr:relaxase/mobilization nuclease domain-containing protein [Streptomyces regalis]KUL26380.1 mobilization protein [Streptomyces regalis]
MPSIHERGSETIGLIRYLYGPGTEEEHIDPHLVAAFDPLTPDPGRAPKATYEQLQRLLDQPINALPTSKRPKKHVWHLSVRAAPEDPVLSDDDWAAIARRMVNATGIAPDGDEAACRWAAVRHADDHIHIIATLVRDDGRRPRLHNEARRAQTECRRIEADYHLRRVPTGDGTAAKRPTSAERHKAKRQGKDHTSREELRETVRRAVAGATSEEEFFDRLAAAGVLIRKRVAPSGDLLGYKVASPDDRNREKEPVFYAGSTLAPDLSLPRIRQRWAGGDSSQSTETAPDQKGQAPASSGTAMARRRAASAVWQAVLVVDDGEDAQVAAQIAAAGEVLDALAKTSAAHTRAELREAAFAYERATRSHIQAERGHDRALRQAARDLVHSGPALGRGEDSATTAMAIDMLFFLVTAAAHWHAKKNHAQQAAAARQAAEHLRTAYRAAADIPLGALYLRGRHLPQPLRQRQAVYLRQAVPELAEQALAEPGWFALAATLADAEAAGHDPAGLLSEAAGRRELATADSVSEVLMWRLRRMTELPADATAMPQRATTAAPGNDSTARPAASRSDQPGRAR